MAKSSFVDDIGWIEEHDVKDMYVVNALKVAEIKARTFGGLVKLIRINKDCRYLFSVDSLVKIKNTLCTVATRSLLNKKLFYY